MKIKNYKFVKIQDHFYDNEHIFDWMLECSDVKTLIEHSEKYVTSAIEESVKEFFYNDNTENKIAQYVKQERKTTNNGALNIYGVLNFKLFDSKIKALNKYGKIFLRENGSYTIPHDTHETLNYIEQDSILYPFYTEKDINIMKYRGGKHYYVKIGFFDVVVDNEQKWNSFDVAKEKALEFLKTL